MSAERFWSKVDKTGECWVWTGATNGKGYGSLWVNNTRYYAHRLSYERAFGPIPAGLDVCHRCDNPGCVRPEHLFLGTRSENLRDMVRKGRARGQFQNGSVPRNAKLTLGDAESIRAELSAGTATGAALARRYGVSAQLISQIRLGKVWESK